MFFIEFDVFGVFLKTKVNFGLGFGFSSSSSPLGGNFRLNPTEVRPTSEVSSTSNSTGTRS